MACEIIYSFTIPRKDNSDPCRVENIKGYKDIKKFSTLNIAGAESIPTARAFKKYLDEDVFDILQFDIATSGFIEGRRICD